MNDMNTIADTLARWKHEDAILLRKLSFAGFSFVLMGIGGLMGLLYPFWFPMLHMAVCH
jgi:hypothetical protein